MDFFARIDQLISSLDPQYVVAILVAAALLIGALAAMALAGARKALFFCLALCMPFAGFHIASIDAASTLLRWMIMFFLALSCLRGIRSPGASNLLLGVFGLSAVSMAPLCEYPLVAIQFSSLWLMTTCLVGGALADDIRDVDDLHVIVKMLLIAVGLYVMLAVSQLPTFHGGVRFGGATSGAPVFVITGGVLLPVAVWSALNLKQPLWRAYASAAAILVTTLLLFSGQRTGTYAGIIACLPIVLRFTPRGIAVTFGIVISIVLCVWVASVFFPQQAEFAIRRYSTLDVTGRQAFWREGWEICTREPLIAHGIKSHVDFHNMFFEACYRGGLQGLLVVLAALAVLGAQAWKLCTSWRSDPDLAALGRLTLGILTFILASSFTEDKLISPSNITIIMATLFGVVASRACHMRSQRRFLDWQGDQPGG